MYKLTLYEFLEKEKGYSDDDLEITRIELEVGIPLPENVREDIREYWGLIGL